MKFSCSHMWTTWNSLFFHPQWTHFTFCSSTYKFVHSGAELHGPSQSTKFANFFCKFRWWKKKQFHMVHLCEYENVIITNFYQECGCGWKFLSFLGQSMNFGIFFNSLTHALTFKKMYCNNSVIYGVSLLLIFQATHITAFLVSPCLLWCAQCAKTRKKVHFSAGQCTVCLKG